jgi:hypothetical protein
MERFHNRPSVQWTGRRFAALENRIGAQLLTDTAWSRDQLLTGIDRMTATRRRLAAPVVRRIAGRLDAAVSWLEATDPARELLARVRLAGAMRSARAALAARAELTADTEARPQDRPRDRPGVVVGTDEGGRS